MITQHIDRIVTRKDFRTVDSIYVTSIFETLQGEGPYAGQPCLFLRLAGCNFGDKSANRSCEFCDTSFQLDKATHYTVETLTKELASRMQAGNLNLLVVTGGEPTLQANLAKVLGGLSPTFTVQFETNGTQGYFPAMLRSTLAAMCNPIRIDYVVSPKANAKAGRYPRIAEEYLNGEHRVSLKFVVTADASSPHHTLPEWAFGQGPVAIYVSPMAVYARFYEGEVSNAWDHTLIDAEATSRNYAYAAQYTMELARTNPLNAFRLSIQTHLFTNIP